MPGERSPLLAPAHASPPHEELRPALPPSPARSMGTPRFPFHPRARSTPFWRKLMLMLFDGHRHVTTLRESDVWPLEPQFEGERAATDLRRHIPERGRWRLARGVCGVNKHRLLSTAALRLVGIALNVARPLLLYRWLCTADEMGYRYELGSLVGVALLRFAAALVMCHSREIDMRVHWQTYSALFAMITDRIVNVGSLATAGGAMDATTASVGYKQRLTQITKTLVNDLEAIGESLVVIASVWAGVIKLAASILVLTWVVHIPHTVLWSAIAAYAAVFVVSFAVGEPLARRAESAFVFRLNTVHECLKGIQMVKLNAWEDKMEAKIQQARDNERRAANGLRAVMLVIQQLIEESPVLFTAIAFSSSMWEPTVVTTGASAGSRPFTPARALVALVLFGDCLHDARFMKYAFETSLVGIGAWQRVESLLLGDISDQRSAVAPPSFSPAPPSASVVVEMHGVCLSSPQTSSSSAPTLLINVNWKVYQGELVVVHGAAGLGKSMLLGAIRDDLSVVQLLQGSTRPVPSDCRVAYCSQDPWLQAVSIRENILFGTEFDKQKYWTVIDACGLLEDLTKLPEGDATAVGPRGINLSSGQCARIALARACYADADLYLLDCPLANVDPVVQSEIFRKCIVELLMFKTVVIVTHNPEYIGSTYVDQLVHVQPLSVRVTNRSSKRKLQESNASTVSRRLRDYQRSIPQREQDDRSLSLVPLSRDAMCFVDQVTSSRKTASSHRASENKNHLLLFTRGFQYLFQAHRGYALLSLILISLVGVAFCARDVWIMKWAAESSFVPPASGTQAGKSESAMLVYVCLVVASVVLGLAARACIALLTSQHAGQLFSTMTHAVLHSSMTLFYHTPIGETINRYYSDMMAVDELLPQLLSLFAVSVVSFASRVLIVGWVLGPVGVVFFVVGYAVATQTLSNAFCVKTTLLLLNTRAMLLSLVSEVVDGEAVIRAFGSQRTLHVFRTLERMGDTFKRTAIFISVFNNSVILASELMTTAIILSLLALVASRDLTPVEHGLILLNAFMLQNEIIGRFSTGLINTVICFSCAERLRKYGNLEAEVDVDSTTKVLVPACHAAWPQQGSVVFENVDFSYTSNTGDTKAAALALRNVSFSIRGGEKIGVIGRTGSGKSSLAMALLRVHPLRSGHISIDAKDLRTVPLIQLRRSVTMIPQSPTFYRCSVRDYLDPFHEFDDARLWRELLTVELGARVQSLEEELLDNGENWSLGQRQLLCFARALLKPSRVVVLDEAFSCVDQSCQEKILRVLRDCFASSTVVLITHRLDQILEFDRILVMRGGRLVESGSASELASDAGSVFYEFLETSLLTF